VIENCAEREQEDRSMLGPAQERWLRGHLASTPARWKVIGQQMLMAQLEQKPGEGEAWGRLPGGASAVADLKRDFNDRTSPTVATEFVGTPVTSEGVPFDIFSRFLPENPHIRFFESRERGYVLAEVTPRLWRTELRVVDTITQPEATARR
jgi:alkaline phosphatase D